MIDGVATSRLRLESPRERGTAVNKDEKGNPGNCPKESSRERGERLEQIEGNRTD